MRVLKRILSWTIWSILGLHIAVLLLAQLPAVQGWLGGRVAALMTEALGTETTVGRVNLGLFNRIIIDDVTIPDLQGDTLLRVGRLSVKAEMLPLLDGRIAISSAQLFGAHARLYQADSTSAANYQFVIDALASSDTTTSRPLDLHIGSLIVRRSSVTFDRGDAFTTPGRFNPAHVAIRDISTHITLKSLTPDSLNINVRRLSLREESGFAVNDFTARLTAGHDAAHLLSLRLQLPLSTLTVDTLDASYTAIDHSQITIDSYHATLGETTITPTDFAALIPYSSKICQPAALTALPSLNLSGAITGTGKELYCHYLSILASNGGLALNASGGIKGDSLSLSDWHIDLGQLDVSSDMLATLKEAFPAIPDELSRLGNVRLAGKASQLHDGQADCQATVATGLGDARLLFAMDSRGKLSGHITTDSLHLGRMLANDNLGSTAADITFGGTKEQMEASGTINHISFKGHKYRDIAATATYQPQAGNIAANITIDDPDLKADAEIALTNLNPQTSTLNPQISNLKPQTSNLKPQTSNLKPQTSNLKSQISNLKPQISNLKPQISNLKSQISIRHLCPSALALTSKWGDAIFSGDVDADISGSSLTDITGHLRLDDFTMRTPTDSLLCLIDHLLVTSDIDGDQRLITLSSDIADGKLAGQFDFSSLPKDFNLRLAVKDARWVQPLLGIPLNLKHYLLLTAATDADDHNNILCSLAWGEAPATDGDSLRTTLGIFNAVTQLHNDDGGQPVAHIAVKPSKVVMADTPWLIHPSHLTYHDNHLQVDNFAVSNGNLHLIIDGTASASPADTLTVDMDGIDIAYIQDLLDFHPVDFAGQLKGKAKGTAILGDFNAWADVTARDFHFMDGRMGTLMAKAQWNKADGGQIDIDAIADEGGSGVILGVSGEGGEVRGHNEPSYLSPLTSHPSPQNSPQRTLIKGYISPVRSDIDLKIRAEGTNIEFCHSFTESFLKDISGKAHGTVELAGPLGDMNLTGALTVDGQMTVSALNTTYRLVHDTIHFVPNDIQLRNVALLDRDGNTAILNGGIHHQWLSDFTFDIDVATQGVLVYDFPTFDDSNICGTVRTTGNADIHVRPGDVVINCNVTPQPGSTFSYNAANPDAVSKQDFITWTTTNGEWQEVSGEILGVSGEILGVSGEGGEVRGHNEPSNLSPLTPHPSPPSSDLRINFLINATPGATLRVLMDANTGDYITLNGEGTIRASFHNKGPFQMFGTYTVERGTYGITIQNIIKKNFTFQPEGTVIFGGDPYEAALNLQAVHTVNGVSLSDLNIGSNFASNTVRVNCMMNITGTPLQPQVDFDLVMPTVNSEENQMIRSLIASKQEMNQQVLYLLGIGRFYTQGANNADAQQYGQTTLAMQSFLSGTVSTQINEVLSQVIKSNDWNFGANISTGDEGWNNAEYEGMVSGRLLNNRLLVNGQFGYRDKATQATPSFIGDFDLQYFLKQNGNLAVKVYNQTNDRYFTRSALNTQGVGLVMKKDFDGLGELLRKKKKTKKTKTQ